MNSSKQIKIGATLSYVQMGLGVVIGLIYTPIMIRLLGNSEYGLYNTVSSTISMLSILSLGFNSSYIRFYSKYKVDNDKDGIAKLNGVFLLIFVFIGFIALICGLFISNNLGIVFKDGLTKDEYDVAKVLMLLLTFNLAISFPMSVFLNIISSQERFVVLKAIGIIKTVLGPLVTLPLLLIGYRSIVMVSATVAINLLADLCYLYYAIHVLHCRFSFCNFPSGIVRDLFIFTSFIAVNMIIDQINWNIDKMLLARYKGTTAVAIYSVGFTLYQYYQMFSTSISSVFTPRIHKICNLYNNDRIKRDIELNSLFIRVGRLQFLVLALISSGLVFFGKYFIKWWAGEEYGDSYWVALLLIIPSSIALIQNIGIEVQRAQYKHKFRSIAYSIMAIVNLVVSIYLCQLYGPIGSAIGTAFSLVLANGIIMNIYYKKKCGLNVSIFWLNIIRICKGLIFPVTFGIIYNRIVHINSFWLMIVGIIIYTIIYAISMWLLGMNEYERSLVKTPVQKILTYHR